MIPESERVEYRKVVVCTGKVWPGGREKEGDLFFFFLNQIIVRRGIVPHIALYWLRSIVRPPAA